MNEMRWAVVGPVRVWAGPLPRSDIGPLWWYKVLLPNKKVRRSSLAGIIIYLQQRRVYFSFDSTCFAQNKMISHEAGVKMNQKPSETTFLASPALASPLKPFERNPSKRNKRNFNVLYTSFISGDGFGSNMHIVKFKQYYLLHFNLNSYTNTNLINTNEQSVFFFPTINRFFSRERAVGRLALAVSDSDGKCQQDHHLLDR